MIATGLVNHYESELHYLHVDWSQISFNNLFTKLIANSSNSTYDGGDVNGGSVCVLLLSLGAHGASLTLLIYFVSDFCLEV